MHLILDHTRGSSVALYCDATGRSYDHSPYFESGDRAQCQECGCQITPTESARLWFDYYQRLENRKKRT